ncbi:DNA/RNA non-specific endonuclease [Rhizobium gallicum]|uniref:DNA/RNA non-specific endonuclease n=1 Tax=Rhizobium gallicum TaxID=56730 RepID=UPI001EF921B9|nr:DNA/RNA non-specific endonuclease [Rhizobium gallicum]ULJ74483.1 DNA/RNA non-specific endonuclease [Rhizobium gallicum]
MEMDEGLDEILIEKAKQASERWDIRTDVREARSSAVASGNPLESDTASRLAARVNVLVDDVRRSTQGRRMPSNPTLKSLVERPMPVTAEELDAETIQEVVFATRDFQSVEFLERGIFASRSVGRILIRAGGGFKARGTGFLVAPGLLMTNEHVLSSPALAGVCVVEMDYEQNRFGPEKHPQIFALEPERFFLCDPDLDFALVAVAAASDHGVEITSYGWLPLNGAQGKIAIVDGDYINIVQHPLGREKEVVIRNNRVLDMRTSNNEPGSDALGAFLHYEADTEKGSSGSPVSNDSWEVVALHHSGVPAKDEAGNWLDKDGNIWRRGEQPVERIQWVANEAVRVSSLVAAISIAKIAEHEQPILKTLLSKQPPGQVGLIADASESLGAADLPKRLERKQPESQPHSLLGRKSREPDPGAATASIELPLRITVTVGEGRTSRVAIEDRAVAAPELLLERLDPQDFADRDGYNRHFLGVPIPMPSVKRDPRFGGALRVPRPARPSDIAELRYYNHSIIMCAERRLAYISACNLDFAAPAMAGRKDGRTTWRTDPRLDARDQLASRFYDHNDYDKGHLTRRDDAAWGKTLAAAVAANDDTFFYTNAAPQHFLFNQSDEFTGAGLNLWGDLENHISKQAAAQRTKLSIFNGPIFGDQDKPLHDAVVPLSFYKIVVWRDGNDAPGAAGFVLDQSELIEALPEEAIDAGKFAVRQRPIAQIEQALDINFGQIKEWDRFDRHTGEEAADEDEVIILSPGDIRV